MGIASLKERFSMGQIAGALTLAYLAVCILVPKGSSTIVLLAYTLCMGVLGLLAGRDRLRRFFSIPTIVLCVGLVVSLGLMFAFSPYPKANAVRLICYLICLAVVHVIYEDGAPDGLNRWFLRLASLAILVLLIIKFTQPGFFEAHSPFERSNGEDAPLLPSGIDKNGTALFAFMVFCMCFKARYVPGIVLGLLYPLSYFGRQYIMMMGIFILFELLLFIAGRIEKKRDRKLFGHPPVVAKFVAVFLAFVLSFGAMAAFSTYWLNNVSSQGVEEYKTSLNDGSNAMRMLANQVALDRITQDPAFLIYGYDTDIYEALGISQTLSGKNHNVYINGLRLVQPHEEVINTVLKEGVLFSLLYYAGLSAVIAVILRRRNLPIFAALFVGSLVFHSMFSSYTVILLCFAMALARSWKLPSTGAHSRREQPDGVRALRARMTYSWGLWI